MSQGWGRRGGLGETRAPQEGWGGAHPRSLGWVVWERPEPLEKGGVGLTRTVWAGPAAPGPPVLADAELAVGLDALPGPVAAAVHQAWALPRPHAPPPGIQHLPRRAPAA